MMVYIDQFVAQEGKMEDLSLAAASYSLHLQWSAKNGNGTQPFPEEQRGINMPALIIIISVSSIILVISLLKHVVNRINRPEGNIYNGYVVDIELVTHTDRSQDEFVDLPRGQSGVTTVCDPRTMPSDEPPSYEVIEMGLPSYEEISKKDEE